MWSGRHPTARGLAIGLLLVVSTLSFLSACGRASTGPSAFADAQTDTVHITTISVTGDPPASVTISQPDVAQGLLRAAATLPPAPTERACPAIAGPRYELTFLQGGQVVVSATADRSGCPSVTFGSSDVRGANDAFWRLLAQDIADATPPVTPDQLVIIGFAEAHQPATATTITSAAQAQQLYDAILALPALPQAQQCPAAHSPRYELAFFAAGHSIRAALQRGGCGTAQLLPGSVRHVDEAFWQKFDATLAGTMFAPAHPAQLQLKAEPASGAPNATASVAFIQDAALVQRLYTATFALPPLPATMACDAIAGPHYGLTFSTGENIELLSVLADRSGCGTVALGDGDVRLADQAYWGLVAQAARP